MKGSQKVARDTGKANENKVRLATTNQEVPEVKLNLVEKKQRDVQANQGLHKVDTGNGNEVEQVKAIKWHTR